MAVKKAVYAVYYRGPGDEAVALFTSRKALLEWLSGENVDQLIVAQYEDGVVPVRGRPASWTARDFVGRKGVMR